VCTSMHVIDGVSSWYCDLFKVGQISDNICKKIWGYGGSGHWLVRMEWRPAGWSVCLPLLIVLCTIKSRSSLLAPAHPGGPDKRGHKTVVVLVVVVVIISQKQCKIEA